MEWTNPMGLLGCACFTPRTFPSDHACLGHVRHVDSRSAIGDDTYERKAKLAEDICVGCGVCVRKCARGGLSLTSRAQRVITPVNSMHRVVAMASEQVSSRHLEYLITHVV